VEHGVVAALVPLVESHSFHMPVRYHIANILKLMTADPAHARAVAHDEHAVQAAMALVAADDEGTRCEAARALANMLRAAPDDPGVYTIAIDKAC
jgi:hypothetical protein